MGQTLTHGVYLPDEGERNCYSGLAANWQLLDGAVGTVAEHTAALAGKAPDADVVHKTGNETIAGNKAFSNNIDRKSTSYEIGTTPASDASLPINFKDKNDTSVGWIRSLIKSSGDTIVEIISSNKFKNGALDTTGTQKYYGMTVGIDNTGNPYHRFSGKLKQSELPFTDSTYDLGSSSYQWNNLYAKNYYYNGTAWGLDKENVWSGNNTFTGNVTINKNAVSPTTRGDVSLSFNEPSNYIFFRTRGSSNIKSFNAWLWAGYLNGSAPNRYGRIRLYRASAVYGETGEETPDTSFSFIDVALHYKWVSLTDNVRFINDETANACEPLTNNATDLGTSGNKWKTLNGVNPGALSLPDLSVSQNVDTNGWVYNGTTLNSVLLNSGDTNVTKNGWLYIRTNNTVAGDRVAVRLKNVTAEDPTTIAGEIGFGHIEIFVPLVAGYQAYVFTNKAPTYIKFYPCLGNVPSGV